MDRKICEKCSCTDCVVFVKNGDWLHVRNWIFGESLDMVLARNPDCVDADSVLMKSGKGAFWYQRRVDSEIGRWSKQFDWRLDGLLPDSTDHCACYAEQFMLELNRKEK